MTSLEPPFSDLHNLLGFHCFHRNWENSRNQCKVMSKSLWNVEIQKVCNSALRTGQNEELYKKKPKFGQTLRLIKELPWPMSKDMEIQLNKQYTTFREG